MFEILICTIILFVLIIVGNIIKSKMKIRNYSNEKKEYEERTSKFPFNERKCSSCEYGYNIKKYINKERNQEFIGAECRYNCVAEVNGFYVRGIGKGKFVWEKDHIGCENYDNSLSVFDK